LFDSILLLALAQSTTVDVLDIRAATGDQVDSIKRESKASGWWLEMGDTLVIAGDPSSLHRRTDLPVIGTFTDVDAQDLVLVGRGCAEPVTFGTTMASSGRWQLRVVGRDESWPADDPHITIRPFVPNTVLARQYRFDGHARGATDPLIQQVVDSVDAARWFTDVTTVAGFDRSSYATTSLAQARDFIGGQLQSLGLDVTYPNFTMNSPGGTITRQNVIGRWTGTSAPNEWIIVGAHYDSRNANANSTTGTPGAEDNASGCAGVIELARVLLPQRPTRSVLFMCYSGEEQGLLGSAAHVQSLTSSGQLANVEAVVIMDMIGYSQNAALDALYESEPEFLPFMQQFGAAAATYVPQLNIVYSTNPFGSDHMPYLNAGLTTLLAIEDDWDVYPHYHRSTDTPANLGPNAQAMGGAILKTNAAVLSELVGRGSLFKDGFE